MSPRTAGAIAAALMIALSACGGQPAATLGMAGTDVEPLPDDLLPAEVLGLSVAPEDVTETVAQVEATYVEALSVYSFRRDKLLQATLQVSRFGDDAADTDEFRQSVVAQVGGASPKRLRAGDEIVYLTSGTNQNLWIWFRDRHFFVLAVREDFLRPRALLRNALEVQP